MKMKKSKPKTFIPGGSLKISNFFKKLPAQNTVTDKSEDDKKQTVLENITNTPPKSSDKKKRKLSDKSNSVSLCNNKKVCNDSQQTSPECVQSVSSTSPEKRTIKQEINYDELEALSSSPDKWLITEAKIIQNYNNMPNNNSNIICTPIKQKMTPDKSNITPNKSGRIKLFEKSPKNLEQFNVEVLNNFIKITPSKTNKRLTDNRSPQNITGTSSEKKQQSSILKYVSPSNTKRSLEIQAINEQTPGKSPNKSNQNQQINCLKVKMKLDFGNCSNQSNQNTINITVEQPINSNHSNIGLNSDEKKYFLDDEDSWNDDFVYNPTKSEFNLNLEQSQHCRVTSLNKFPQKTVIEVQSTKNTDEKAVCNLEGFWMNFQLNIGDIIHLKASKTAEKDWIINNETGLLVYEPDLLISSTTVVNSIFCKRRSVLTERYQGFEPSNRHMVIGTLVHTLLETVLKNKLNNRNQIENVLLNLIKQSTIIRNLYESDLNLKEIQKELEMFIPRIIDFIENYVNGKEKKVRNNNKDNWRGHIDKITDIEENIWLPELGIKGKVDVTVESNGFMMPLELKTGRASVSIEHRGQVILYLMMMEKLGYKISSGLLLYLREGVLKEIPMSHKEERDIIILRNELAYYLTKSPKIINESEKLLAELPEPIHHHNACSKCPYNVICTSYLKYENFDLTSNKQLDKVQKEVTSHLSSEHLNYFIHWSTLLGVESKLKSGTKELQEIYTVPPETREMNGKCIANVKVEHVSRETTNGLFEYTFNKFDKTQEFNFLTCGITESNYIVVSSDTRPAVATGFVTNITSNSIQITLDRDLSRKYQNSHKFHLDIYDSTIMQSFNLTSLALILENTERAKKLRELIIDKKQPKFLKKLPTIVAEKAKPILCRLNKVQQRAILKTLTAKDYLLIKGMPGTGKTATIVALIQLLVELDKTVLITSHTNSAVDHVCIQLQKYGVDILRLGSDSRINEKLRSRSEYNLTKHCRTPEELSEIYNSAKVVAVTCLGSGHPLLSKRTLDYCIVDESTQVLQSAIVKPIYSAKTFILIGDPDQLPPVVRNIDAIKSGMSQSLFERLDNPESRINLTYNYRMNKTITAVANSFTYKGELLIGNENIANACLKINNIKELKVSTWLERILDTSLDASFQIIDTGPVWNLSERTNLPLQDNYVNKYEIGIVLKLIETLLKVGISGNDIGVMSPYRMQVTQISTLLSNPLITVSTVDQFQGQDKNVIIYSCTKSEDINNRKVDRKYEILEDKRRLTVAITRAKHKLILISDIKTIENYSTFSHLLKIIDQKNIINLNEFPDFNWNSILEFNSVFKS